MKCFGRVLILCLYAMVISTLAACGGGDGGESGATDNTPVANAGEDQTVDVGQTILLDGGASYAPDGTALSYSWTFKSCPDYSCPSLRSYDSETPSFVPKEAGDYVLELHVDDGQRSSSDTVTITASITPPADPDLLSKAWTYAVFGSGVGHSGFSVQDLDGDGALEIIATATSNSYYGNNFWYVLNYDGADDYRQVWTSPYYPNGIEKLIVADGDGDGALEIYVLQGDGKLQVFSAALEQEMSVSLLADIEDMVVADADADGAKDIVITDGTRVSVYSAATFTLLWQSLDCAGRALAVGNVDGDPAPEIVTTTYDGHGYVIDGGSGELEWDYINGFGIDVEIGDTDNDGLNEIVAAASWGKITVIDAEKKTPSREFPTSEDINALTLIDVDGDAVPEILYGDGQWGAIHCVDGVSGVEQWSIDNPGNGASNIAVGDVDQDGALEILWGTDGTSFNGSAIFFADIVTGQVEWSNIHMDGPLSPLAVGDVDDDGQTEIIMASFGSNGGYDEGLVTIFDAATHFIEWQSTDLPNIYSLSGISSVRIGDVDGDNQTEFVLTTDNLHDGVIQIYDGATHGLERESAPFYGESFTSLEIGDVDGDGQQEIIVGTKQEHSGAIGTHLMVFEGTSANLEWQSVDLSGEWGNRLYDIDLDDVDGDGQVEIIATVEGGRVYAFDGASHQLDGIVAEDAYALETADLDGDGQKEVVVGKGDGNLAVYDGASFLLKEIISTAMPQKVEALRLDDVDGDGSTEWLTSSTNRLSVFDGSSFELLWQSDNLAGGLGLYNQLISEDIDGDGRKEILAGSQLALYQFD